MAETPHNIDDEARLQAATDWLFAIEEKQADLAAFENWREEPMNALAFLRVSRSAHAVRDLQHFQHPIGLGVTSGNRGIASRRNFLFGGGATVAASVAVAAGLIYFHPLRASATTRIGDFSTIQLPQGNKADLNTNSKMSWDFGNSERRIWLERGEVSLTIVSDPRPCILMSLGVRALLSEGKFNARMKDGKLILVPVRGSCAVASDSSPHNRTVVLKPGQKGLLADSNAEVQQISDAQISSVTAWEQRQLDANGMTVAEIANELNRYRVKPIRIVGDQLSNTRVLWTGGLTVNSIDDQNAFVDLLHVVFGARVERDPDGTIVAVQNS